jgi:hypothetical protein
LACAAAAVIAGLAPLSPAQAQDGPRLVEQVLYTSDIQYSFTRSPDNKAISVRFDNFSVVLAPGSGAAPATRVFPLRIPVNDADKGVTLHVEARGRFNCPDGVACVGILWVNGQTTLYSSDPGKDLFHVDVELSLPAAEVYQAAVMLIADRETKRQDLAASIRIDTLELTIAPPPAETGPGKN